MTTMAIVFSCNQCNHRLRVPEDVAGKRIKCPQCQQVLRIPEASPSSPADAAEPPPPETPQTDPSEEDRPLQLKTPDGSIYGPVSRDEMDQWFSEGRITELCELLDQYGNHWRWSNEVYPSLDTASPPPPPPAEELRQATPITVHPIATNVTAAASASSAQPPLTEEIPPKAGPAENDTMAPRFRSRSYPTMNLTIRFYRALGWILIFLGAVGAFFFSVIFIGGVMVSDQLEDVQRVMLILQYLAVLISGAIVIATLVVTVWFAAEAIRCLQDIEDNSHRCSFYLHLLQQRSRDD
jgi:phage FluMu protein Com